jgi:hypothetical protein
MIGLVRTQIREQALHDGQLPADEPKSLSK